MTARVTPLSQWVEIEGDEISFGDIDHGDEAESDDNVTLTISPACPDGESRPHTRPDILIVFSSGDVTWESAIKLNPSAPHYIVKEIVGGNIIETGVNDLDIEIENVGSMDGPPLSARIVTLGLGASAVNRESDYPQINSGRSARLEGRDFTVAGNAIFVPGGMNPMLLILSSLRMLTDSIITLTLMVMVL